ncbi:MAG: hypothetical protein N2B60_08660 [Psychrobacter sp.]
MKIKLLVLILVSLFAVNAQAVTPYDYVCPEEDYKCESEQINKITQYVFTQYLNEKIPEYAKPSQIERVEANRAREEAERNRMRKEAKAQNGIKDEVEAAAAERNRAREEAEAAAERNRMREEGMREILKDYSK